MAFLPLPWNVNMRADTQTISIDASSAKVVRFLADPRNLPRWAVGFARSIEERQGQWIVQTGTGEMPLRIDADEKCGVVDFWLSIALGVEALAASRVIPRGPWCEYTFTQFQAPGMPGEHFELSIKAVEHELKVLKALAEVECPL